MFRSNDGTPYDNNNIDTTLDNLSSTILDNFMYRSKKDYFQWYQIKVNSNISFNYKVFLFSTNKILEIILWLYKLESWTVEWNIWQAAENSTNAKIKIQHIRSYFEDYLLELQSSVLNIKSYGQLIECRYSSK